MANIRTFKKELYMVLEIIAEECLIVRDLHPEKAEKAEKLFEEALELYYETRSKKNTDASKSQKKFYADLRNSYLEGIFAILKNIEALHTA
ncbi:MAG: hypothetical protein GX277_09705 [Bacteroidales bacterium]|nr:hypothetical protein [Bacteroidales bacterium]